MAKERPRRSHATDHPESLGRLADVFARRRIAVGADASGNVILARPDTVLVATEGDPERLGRAAAVIDRFDKSQAAELRQRNLDAEGGLLTVRIPEPRRAKIAGQERASLEPLRRHIEDFRRAELDADFNHVLFGSQGFIGHPLGAAAQWIGDLAFPTSVTESSGQLALLTTAKPAESPRSLRQPLGIDGKRSPRVLILDTGLRTADGKGERPEHEVLGSCFVHQPWHQDTTPGAHDDEDELDDDGLGIVDFEAGHGTFIAGIVRQFCPDAEIHTAGVLSSFGDGDVSTVLAALRRVLRVIEPPDIIVMSFGGFFADDDPGAFDDELLAIVGDDPLLIAAAGNEFTCRKCFPAALSDVVGVGALGADGRAWFSNFGGWVDACAPGIDVISTFFTDAAEQVDGEITRTWSGWAKWSGTSFAAPKVAAAIAQEQYLYGGTAKQAWKRLSTHKHLRVPDLGVAFNL